MDYLSSILSLGAINAIAVLGLSIFTGFTGMFSLGHSAFVGIGAYVSAVLTYYYFVPFPLALLGGSLSAGLISCVVGAPALRADLRSDYFAIAILGFGEAFRVAVENLDITNGARGLPGLDPLSTPLWIFGSLGVCLLLAVNFVRSPLGRCCAAVREDPVAAQMAGVSLFRVRLGSLMVSALLCGLSGGLMAHYLSFVQPSMFTLTQSTMLLAAVIAGGMGSLSGPLIMSFLFVALPEALRVAQIWRLVAYGFVLVAMMILRPSGLMGYRELWDLIPRSLAWRCRRRAGA
ncbi:ABC-type branched-chain amino acid transport system, permease component [Thermanaerovibrio velox DSM 12556]|uniref:ABC-type branched-chain amino acid transport system, permease component n=1 Tax=Thermanaerovibrio velox DSM 12556 TaxID=926567 RepID=H0UP75_9BACT|nr:branched-chain amino acid ABC transporter permease [Thermanaerovibrio velox]EHM09488.1 ABC-type branched-chain amino acid transport system, permease component [Thermanaerovibrio velox DSM 12556]